MITADIKNLFCELKFWDDLTIGECEWTEPLLNYYRLWEKVCKMGFAKTYEEWKNTIPADWALYA